ncbi:MAG: 4Fe-4S binding protein [Lachnospiraceae bacterium]|nr:4Fe-4S binding protein [Lachnospiraceae bacterium]
MLEANYTLENVKHVVLYEVAKRAFEGRMEEIEATLPYEMAPGPKANFRCCVYKEREILKERIRLAQGKDPAPYRPRPGIVQILRAACEGCPITRFSVTDNCQRCMSKKCQQACRFGAISMQRERAYIDADKCKECGRCAEACPYHAIADLMRPCKRSCPVDAISTGEDGIVNIDYEKCIQCGNCIKNCPFGAISEKSFMVDVIKLIRAGIPVHAMVAPAVEGQFGKEITMGSLADACKELGFASMIEVALGGDMVADSEAKEWAEAYEKGEKKTTSCCPAFVNMIHKHFPELIGNISTTVSPMQAVSRLLKQQDPAAVTVFVGPCVAKKNEVLFSHSIEGGNADYALTFDELQAMFEAKGVVLKAKANDFQQGSVYGKRFGNAGGVTKAVLRAFEEQGVKADVTVKGCNGALECKNALLLMKLGKLPADFIEGMVCVGGCVNGPGSVKWEAEAKRDRDTLIGGADSRGIQENIAEQEADRVPMHR